MTVLLINAVALSVGCGILAVCHLLARRWPVHLDALSVMWVANLIIGQLAIGGVLAPNVRTLVVMYGAWLALLGASAVSYAAPQVFRPVQMRLPSSRARLMLIALIALQWLGVLYELRAAGVLNLSGLLNLPQALSRMRVEGELLANMPTWLSIWRWSNVIYIPLAFLMWRRGQVGWRTIAVVVVLALASTPTRFTRAPMIAVVATTLACWVVVDARRRWAQLATAAALGAGGAAAFLAMQQLIVRSDPRLRDTEMIRILAAYIGASPKAYEELLHAPPVGSASLYSLESLSYVLYKLGLIREWTTIRPQVFLPGNVTTNVYTFLDAFTLDFGAAGAVLGSAAVGLLLTWVHRRASTCPNLPNLVIYGYFMNACLMLIANNEFVRISVLIYATLAWMLGRLLHERLWRLARIHRGGVPLPETGRSTT